MSAASQRVIDIHKQVVEILEPKTLGGDGNGLSQVEQKQKAMCVVRDADLTRAEKIELLSLMYNNSGRKDTTYSEVRTMLDIVGWDMRY